MKKYITNKDLVNAFKKVGLSPTYKVGEWINIARPDGIHCEFYPNADDNYAFTATYIIKGKETTLDFFMPYDINIFVSTVCEILEHKPKGKQNVYKS